MNKGMGLNSLRDKLHSIAVEKGFWAGWDTNKDDFPMRLMLTVTELGECCEAHRKKDWTNVKEELADTIIRVLDICGGYGIDIETEVLAKTKINEGRPHKHGKEY